MIGALQPRGFTFGVWGDATLSNSVSFLFPHRDYDLWLVVLFSTGAEGVGLIGLGGYSIGGLKRYRSDKGLLIPAMIPSPILSPNGGIRRKKVVPKSIRMVV